MAQTVNVNFRLDEVDKKRMENVCNELGLSMNNLRYLEEKLENYKAGKLKLAEHELIED